ncbi:MAG: amidase, partial [Myxococcota bacterium]
MSKDRVQWAFATCTEQLHGMATGQIRSRDLVETYLARIEENKELNAVVSIAPERARAEADRMDAERASGRQSGRLHGIPVTLKDSFETEGLRTTAGSESLAEYEPSKDAPTVARLRQQGAIIMGKTNMPTFNLDLQAQNPVFGATKNPHDPSRTSGGSAATAAA